MTDVPIPPQLVRDPAEKNQPGIGVGRDPQRTPMPWDASPHGGFTRGGPWLPMGPAAVNVAAQQDDPGSMLALYRRLIALRRESPALVSGQIGAVTATGPLLSFTRTHPRQRLRILLNLGAEPCSVAVPEAGRILCSTLPGPRRERSGDVLWLAGDEGVVLELA